MVAARDGYFTEEWLTEVAIPLISEVVVPRGPEYGPWLDFFELELEATRVRDHQQDGYVSRAQRHLDGRRGPR